jgi:DNA polymerase-3 subunit delta
MNACNNNYDLIFNEINKMFLYYNEPQDIKLDDVKNIVSKSLIDNNFKFVEAVIAKNFKKALIILDDLYRTKVDPIALIMLLAREYRLMLSVNILMSNGYHKSTIGKELSLQDWQIDKLMRSNSSYYNDELKEYLKELSNIDFKIKSGAMDKFMGLKTFLLQID